MQWGGKQLAPGSQLPSQQNNGGWPTSLHQSSVPNHTSHNTAPNPLQSHFSFNQQYNFNSTPNNPVNTPFSNHSNTPFSNHSNTPFSNHSNTFPNVGNLGSMGNLAGNGGFGGFGNSPNVGGGRVMGGMNGMVQQNRGLPAEVLQQNLLRRKFAEQTNFMNINDNR